MKMLRLHFVVASRIFKITRRAIRHSKAEPIGFWLPHRTPKDFKNSRSYDQESLDEILRSSDPGLKHNSHYHADSNQTHNQLTSNTRIITNNETLLWWIWSHEKSYVPIGSLLRGMVVSTTKAPNFSRQVPTTCQSNCIDDDMLY